MLVDANNILVSMPKQMIVHMHTVSAPVLAFLFVNYILD